MSDSLVALFVIATLSVLLWALLIYEHRKHGHRKPKWIVNECCACDCPCDYDDCDCGCHPQLTDPRG